MELWPLLSLKNTLTAPLNCAKQKKKKAAKTTSVFPHAEFNDRLSKWRKVPPAQAASSSRQTDRQTESPVHPVFSPGQDGTQHRYITCDFSFNRRVPFTLRSSSQIVITSCKAICPEALCWWPPAFKQGGPRGRGPADDFSKHPS